MQAGVVLNPHTPVSCLEEIITDVDLVLLMTTTGRKKKTTATPMCERQNGHETVTTIRLIFQIKTSQEKRITLHGKIAGHGMEWNELQPK